MEEPVSYTHLDVYKRQVYGGSDTTASNIHLASTSITMNGGTVYNITGGNKTKNEKACDYSIIDQVTLDIKGGVITLGVYGIDNQNTAFGTDVRNCLLYTSRCV